MSLRRRLAFLCAGAALAIGSTIAYEAQKFVASAVSPNVTIDYTHETPLDPHAVGMDETGYQSPNVLANDSLEQQRFQALGLGYVRMDLKYSTPGDPTSKIICGGSGCDTAPTGDQWIGAIKSIGAQPAVLLATGITTTDASNLVKHFNVSAVTGLVDPTLPNYVRNWIIGNEPDINGYSAATYSNDFNADSDAMKAVDPNVKIGGGATAWYDYPFLKTFLQTSGSRVDFLDFHGYAQQGCSTCTPSTDSSLFQWAQGIGGDVTNLSTMIRQIVPTRASQIAVEVGEWSLDWGGNLQANTNLNSVWSADVLGNILHNGGDSMFYGTKGNALEWASGFTTDQDIGQQVYLNLDDPHASYHGFGMFTGEGLFPRFGTSLVNATTTLPNVDVFASDNPKNIVVVNKDPSVTQIATFSLGSAPSGAIDVWQKNPTVAFQNPPVHLGNFGFSGGTFSYALPALSVTTFVVSPGATGPTTTTTTMPTTTTTMPTTTTTTATGLGSGTVVANDTFSRANQTYWGNASDGLTWGGDANSQSVFRISADTGYVGSAWTTYSGVLGPTLSNSQVLCSGSISSFSNANFGAVLRWQDGSHWYKAYVDGGHLVLQKKVGSTLTNIGSVSFAAGAGVNYTLRFQAIGTVLYAKVWMTGSAEPGWMVQATDSTFASGQGGLRMLSQGGSVSYTSFTLYSM